MYIILSNTKLVQSRLNSIVSRLSITLEVYAIQPRQPGKSGDGGSSDVIPAKELIFTGTIDNAGEPLLIIDRHGPGGGAGDNDTLYMVWKMRAVLSNSIPAATVKPTERKTNGSHTGRPRSKAQFPFITFLASASLRTTENSVRKGSVDDYLPSKIPASINLLEPLQDAPGLAHAKPYLSAARVSRMIPATSTAARLPKRLESSSKYAFRIVPAVNLRIGYSKLSFNPRSPSIIASLDVEAAPIAECDILFEEISLWLERGSVASLMTTQDGLLPLMCKSEDNITLLYQLVPDEVKDQLHTQSANHRAFEVFMSMKAIVSEDCQPLLTMKWRANIDFTAALNSSYGGLKGTSHHSNYALASPNPAPGLNAASAAQVTGAGVGSSQVIKESEELGLTVTLCGPDEVYVGEVFRWNVLIVNRSSQVRRLSLTAIPKRGRNDKTGSRSSVAPMTDALSPGVAKAVLDEDILHAMQSNAVTDTVELISLSADVKIGSVVFGFLMEAMIPILRY